MLRICAARAASRLVKLILPQASIIGRASNVVISMCSTTEERSSALRFESILASAIGGAPMGGVKTRDRADAPPTHDAASLRANTVECKRIARQGKIADRLKVCECRDAGERRWVRCAVRQSR